MLAPVVVLDLTEISAGLFRYCLEMRRIWLGMVAENSATWRSVGGLLEDLLHVFGEAHAQHLVGLVQHQVLEFGQVQGTLGDVVDHAAGGTDNNLGAAAQAGELGAVGGAAVDREDGEVVDVLGVGGEGLGDLERELAGRSQDQGLGLAGRAVEVVELGQAGQCRYCECCSLTGAGLGEAHDVAAFEQQRDGCCLDRGRLLVADVLQGGEDAAVDAEVGELDAVFVVVLGLGRGRLAWLRSWRQPAAAASAARSFSAAGASVNSGAGARLRGQPFRKSRRRPGVRWRVRCRRSCSDFRA